MSGPRPAADAPIADGGRAPRVALLCSGLGNVHRGHEVFARGLFDLLKDSLDITLLKGGGLAADREVVIPHVPRNAATLDHIHVVANPKWAASVHEEERLRVECETFAYGALKPLLDGDFDIVHCLEQEVCDIVYAERHLFRRTPRVVFSNGGALPARDLPACDFVQEHTPYNLGRSARGKAFMIPHGVDLARFDPAITSDFRARHGIPEDAFVVLSVGTIGYWHKRMDYVIREVAALDGAYLVIAGQECGDTPAIREIGRNAMGDRVVFTTLPHAELPNAYAAADAFALGSLFETFGIAYIEAMAMELPVFCTNHVNQRSIVQQGVFVDMSVPGALAAALSGTDRAERQRLGAAGRRIVEAQYDLHVLRDRYVERYRAIAATPSTLPGYTLGRRVQDNLRNALRPLVRAMRRR